MKRKYLIVTLVIGIFFLLTYQNLAANAENLIYKEVTAAPGDTSTELQNLLDFNKHGKYNLTVIIPSGEYLLNKEMRIYSNTTIQADKNAKFLKNHQRGAMLANDLTNDKGGYNTAKNITIMGGIWDSSRVAALDKGTESLRFIHTTDVTIKNLTVSNVPNGSHMITFAGVANGTIENCTLYGYGGTMLKEAIQLDIVHDNIVVPSMQEDHLTYDDLACSNILITGCNIYDYSRAIGSHTSVKGVYHKNITIHNNKLHDLQDTAIKAYNYINLKVSNNTIYNAAMGILVYTYIGNEKGHYLEALGTTKQVPLPANYNIIIKNNTIYDIVKSQSTSTATWGDAIHTIGNSSRPLSGVTIYNNTIRDIGRYGIFLEGTTGSTISRNKVTNTTNSGIYAISGSHYAKINDNILQKTGLLSQNAGGIGLNASKGASILNNSIAYPGKNGIFLYSKSNQSKISNNTITYPGENAIALYSQSNDAEVTSNIIKYYGINGIFTYGIKSANISGNKIYGKNTGNSKDGIHISGDNSKSTKFTVNKNYIKTSRRNAIYVDLAPKAAISNNTIINSIKTAIFLGKGSTNSKLTSNKITISAK